MPMRCFNAFNRGRRTDEKLDASEDETREEMTRMLLVCRGGNNAMFEIWPYLKLIQRKNNENSFLSLV